MIPRDRVRFIKTQSEKAQQRPRVNGRFLAKPIDDYIEVADNGCWFWTGYRNRDGYGCMQRNGKTMLAHRHLYELLVRRLTQDEELDHLCQSPPCVNPKHMTPMNRVENMLLISVRRGKACWYCMEPLSGDVCLRCGGDRRDVFGLDEASSAVV